MRRPSTLLFDFEYLALAELTVAEEQRRVDVDQAHLATEVIAYGRGRLSRLRKAGDRLRAAVWNDDRPADRAKLEAVRTAVSRLLDLERVAQRVLASYRAHGAAEDRRLAAARRRAGKLLRVGCDPREPAR